MPEDITQEAPTQVHANRGMKRHEFVQYLQIKRLGYLERAEMCEELITELGGQINSLSNEGDELFEEHLQSRGSPQHSSQGSDQPGSSPEAEGNRSSTTISGEPDKRFKGNETEREFNARHMRTVPEGQTDGRGAVRNRS